MKKVMLAIFFVFICVSPAFGDEADERLSNMATSEIKAGTRQMIRAGIDNEDAIGLTQAMLKYRFSQENVLNHQQLKEGGL